jgi:hypothetical protein
MPKFVILNLADPGGIGPVSRVKSGVTVKAQAKAAAVAVGEDLVPVHDLFELLGRVQANPAANISADAQAIINDCDSADKIYLCTHGIATDVTHAFAKASGGAALGTWGDFAQLMRKLLPRNDKIYKLALVMCYGARTAEYRASDLNHQGMIPAALLKTSFAYQFFKSLCQGHGCRVTMTARTGAVGFDDKTGQSSVEQEAAIDIALEKEEFLRSPKIDAVMQKWKAYKAAIDSDKKAAEFTKVNEKYRADPDAYASPFSAIALAGKAYHRAVAKKNAMEMRKHQYEDLKKYGKLVYSINAGGNLRVVNKYGNADTGIGPGTVLYEGPFL